MSDGEKTAAPDDTAPIPAVSCVEPWIVQDRDTGTWECQCPETGARGYGRTKGEAYEAMRDVLRGRHPEALRRSER
jgi:hypothetical protein